MITAELHLYPKRMAELRLTGLIDWKIIESIHKSNLLIVKDALFERASVLFP